MLRARPVLLGCALFFAAGASRAQETSFTLRYDAAPGCPERDHFTSELLTRAPWLRETAGAPTFELDVSFEQGTPLTGVLVLREADGQTTTRQVPGADCAEVVSALALISSMLADEKRSAAPSETPASPAPSPRPESKPEPPRPALPVRRKESRLRLGLGAGAGVQVGVAPDIVPSVSFDLSGEWQRKGPLQPLVVLTAERSLATEVVMAQGTAHFRWTALRLLGCPLRLLTDEPFKVRACALFEGGVTEAAGDNTQQAESVEVPWWATGAAARLEMPVLPALSAVSEAGIRVQLRSDSYVFATDSGTEEAFEVPLVGGYGRLALQARW